MSPEPILTAVGRSKLVGTLDGERFYQIANYDRMRPFFMSVVSGSDHWMFISSTGALTAGRGNPDHALFPYTTDDKIHDSAEITGSKTILVVQRAGAQPSMGTVLGALRGVYRIQRNLYKNAWGNKLDLRGVQRGPGIDLPLWLVQQRAVRLRPPRPG